MPKTPHAAILRSRSAKQPFRVKFYGGNGEVLSTSETLTTKRNCEKNIVAHISLVTPNSAIQSRILVVDTTKKQPQKYWLYLNGKKWKINQII